MGPHQLYQGMDDWQADLPFAKGCELEMAMAGTEEEFAEWSTTASSEESFDGKINMHMKKALSLDVNLARKERKKAKKQKGEPTEWKKKIKTEFCRFWLKG